jgi:hypothetical protein
MRRRDLIALLAAGAAAPGVAFADDNHLPLDKAFPLLSAYLILPPAERSRFYLVYRATRDKRPTGDAHAVMVAANGACTPLAMDRIGQVLSLPSLAALKSAATLEIAGAAFKLAPEVRPTIPPSARLDAGQLALALAQLNAAVVKLAGALAVMAPKMTCAYFPDAGSGQALMANGRSTPLPIFPVPILGPVPYFETTTQVGAKTVVLARAPSRILLGPHPKPA